MVANLAQSRELCHHEGMTLSDAADRIDRLTSIIGRGAAFLALFIVVVQFAVVLLRYLFGIGSIWLQESIIYAHAALVLLAAAWTLREDGHVRVDIFYADAAPRTRALIDLCGAMLLLIPFVAVLLLFAVPYAGRSWALLERSREASGIPAVFLLKTLIPLFALLLGLQGVAQAIRAWTVLQTPNVAVRPKPPVRRPSQDEGPGQGRQ
jgi:TRAP-type mannitol/chloroaromatic compound transport system permease small subunit